MNITMSIADSGMKSSVVIPGNHDGVHLGHQSLIQEAKKRAAELGAITLAMFFNPHPSRILAPDRAPKLLTSAHRRSQLLQYVGADEVIQLPFDINFASLSPKDFVQKILVERCNAKGVVVGPDFCFGHQRSGNIKTLIEFSQIFDFHVFVVNPVYFQGDIVSSSRIRTVLQNGDVEQASQLLGRLYQIEGKVVEGHKRGRTIGFPTANIQMDEQFQVPSHGVYAVLIQVEGQENDILKGVANLGTRPTIDGSSYSIEVHIFDFNKTIYGNKIRIEFVSRLRAEQRFDSLSALAHQIKTDCQNAKEVFLKTSFNQSNLFI